MDIVKHIALALTLLCLAAWRCPVVFRIASTGTKGNILAVIRSCAGGRDEAWHNVQARARHSGAGFPLIITNFDWRCTTVFLRHQYAGQKALISTQKFCLSVLLEQILNLR